MICMTKWYIFNFAYEITFKVVHVKVLDIESFAEMAGFQLDRRYGLYFLVTRFWKYHNLASNLEILLEESGWGPCFFLFDDS